MAKKEGRERKPTGMDLLSLDSTQNWLKQFDEADRPLASFLVESLALVSERTFLRGLTELVTTTREKLSQKRPVALYAVRETSSGTQGVPATYFDANDDTVRPNAVGPGGGVGSEGMVAKLIRDLCKESGSSKFLDHPSISTLRATKTRHAFFLDDIIGSGTRASRFASAFYNHRTIRSWHSFKWLQGSILAYAATRTGANAVTQQGIALARFQRSLTRGRASWSPPLLEAVEILCKRYADRAGIRINPNGYKDALTCLVFEHNCPNTTPPILWKESPNGWRPLFKNRSGMRLEIWPDSAGPRAAQLTLSGLGQSRLVLQWEHVPEEHRTAVVILAAIAKRRRSTEILAEMAGIPLSECKSLISKMLLSGWITGDLRLTNTGLRHLNSARSTGAVETREIPLKTGYYFPQSLRGSRGTL